ncbi:type II toxin-antitoxin system VapC family toxin [Candidatus Woesearchaeota archaeon]|nr:type II toxin-antitoxin system VapC family toxin [Candidatus Woesearchaeota archaeon]
MIKFIDANIFIERWTNPKAQELIDQLDREMHCTSVLVLSEVYHKLKARKVGNIFDYLRGIMGSIAVHDFTKDDLFNALKNPADLNVNDKIHIETMKRNKVNTIISYDKDFDRDKTIIREEL